MSVAVVFVDANLINAQASPSSDMPVYGLPLVVVTAPRTSIVKPPWVVVIGHRLTKGDSIDSNVAEHGSSKPFTCS